jgi:hypothetical protein
MIKEGMMVYREKHLIFPKRVIVYYEGISSGMLKDNLSID